MKEDILQLYNEICFTDEVDTYEGLPLDLQEMVSDWEHGYKFLGGHPGFASSRQIASLLFIIWERENERKV